MNTIESFLQALRRVDLLKLPRLLNNIQAAIVAIEVVWGDLRDVFPPTAQRPLYGTLDLSEAQVLSLNSFADEINSANTGLLEVHIIGVSCATETYDARPVLQMIIQAIKANPELIGLLLKFIALV